MARETVATESHWTRFETHPENLLSLGPGEYRITFHKVYKCLQLLIALLKRISHATQFPSVGYNQQELIWHVFRTQELVQS